MSAAFLALAPKCALCLLAYAGLGAAFGLGGPEICGATNDTAGHWTVWLPALGAVAGAAGFLLRRPKPAVSRRYNTTGLSANQPKLE